MQWKWYVYIYIFFIHCSADGHLGCFHVLVIVNSTSSLIYYMDFSILTSLLTTFLVGVLSTKTRQ